MPQSRQRKISKAKKRPRGTYAASGPVPQSKRSRATRTIAIVIVMAIALSLVALIVWWPANRGEVTTASGLKYTDIQVGTGATPQRGQTVTVHYTGTLQNGEKFDSSVDRGVPSNFRIGVGEVIKGWDEGLMTMKVGGKRKFVIPPQLAYGPQGRPGIPPNSTLLFDVELLGVK